MSTATMQQQPITWGILAQGGGAASAGSTSGSGSAITAAISKGGVATANTTSSNHTAEAAAAAAAPTAGVSSEAAVAGAAINTPLWQPPVYASAGGNTFIPGDAVDLNEIFSDDFLLPGMGMIPYMDGAEFAASEEELLGGGGPDDEGATDDLVAGLDASAAAASVGEEEGTNVAMAMMAGVGVGGGVPASSSSSSSSKTAPAARVVQQAAARTRSGITTRLGGNAAATANAVAAAAAASRGGLSKLSLPLKAAAAKAKQQQQAMMEEEEEEMEDYDSEEDEEEDGEDGEAGAGTGGRRRKKAKLTMKPLTEQQRVERRERNREHAKRSRMRKKFMLESLQAQMQALRKENLRLRQLVATKIPEKAEAILRGCSSVKTQSMLSPVELGHHKPLADSDGKLISALQFAQQNFTISDPSLPDNPIVYASQGFLDLTGYRADQIIGRNCRFLQGPGTDPAAVDIIRRGVALGEDTSVCLLNYRADGTPFWNQFFVAALRDDNGSIVNYVGVQCEVAEAPMEEELKQRVSSINFNEI